MRYILSCVVGGVAVLGLSACDQHEATTKAMESTTKAVKEAVEPLQAKITALEKQLKELKGTVTVQGWTLDSIHDTSADVVTDGSSYGVARTQFGQMIVIANDLRPYLDGYKVGLSVANMTSIRFNGAEVKVSWATQYDEKNPNKEIKYGEKTFKITNTFPPGVYSNFDVALNPAEADQVRTISVGFVFDQVSIAGLNKK